MIYVPDYSPYVQYSITIIIFLYSLLTFTFKKIKFSDINLFLLVLLFGVISFTIGILKELNVNPRAIAVPVLFLITINSKSYKLLKPLFIYCLLISVIEIFIEINGITFLGDTFKTWSSSSSWRIFRYSFKWDLFSYILVYIWIQIYWWYHITFNNFIADTNCLFCCFYE